jgi:TP901 family phage tail tape measure protein
MRPFLCPPFERAFLFLEPAMESRLELVVSSQAAQQHISRLQRELERLDGRGSAATAMMGKFNLALGAISAAAGGLGFSRIIRETASFEDAMLGLQAVSGATTRQMADLEKQARTLGATSMFSAEQAGNAQRYLAQAGFEVNEVLSATPGILKLATAGQLDLATAADIASNVLGGLGLEVSELNRVNDVLAATAAGANTNIQQLGEALSYAAPFASKAGLSLEETAAAIGAMSDAGIQSSRAGTGLVGILAQLADATPKAQSAIEGAGLSMEQLDINSRGLQPVLDDLRGANLGLGEALQIFGREAGAAALNVINASEGVAGFTEELRNAEGAAEEMSLIIGGGLTGSMKGFASMLSETIIGLGRDDGLAAGFQSVTDTVTGMLAVYNGMLPAFAEANNLTETQTDRIETLAKGVDLLSDAAIIAAGIYTGRFVAGMAAGTLSLANKTKASIADASATNAATAAEIAFLRSVQGSLSAQLASSRSAMQRASLRKQLAANTAALTAANNTYTASLGRSTVAARAMGTATRGLNTALSLVGGPLGLLVGAGGLMYMFREELGLVDVAAQNATAALNENSNAIRGGTAAALDASYDNLVNSLEAVSLQAQEAMAQLTELTARQSFYENSHQGMADSVAGAIGEQEQALAGLWARQVELQAAIKANREERERSTSADNRSALVLKTLDEWLFKTTKSTDDLSSSTDKAADKTYTLADAYESLLDRITPNRREARQYAQDLGVLNLALASGRMTTTQYMQAMGMLQESFQAAQRDTSDLADNVDTESERMATLWERRLERMDDAGVDMWRSFLDGSEDAFGSFRRLALDTLAEVIHAYTTQRITASLGLNVAGSGGASAGGFNGIGSLVNSGKSLLGFGSTAAAPSLAMQGGLSSAALASASQVATGATYSGALGSAASGAALGNSAGLMSSITSGISAAMPWLAGGFAIDNILGLGITDGITKALSGLFGSDRKSYGQLGSQIGGDRNAGDGVYRYDRNDRSMGWAQQTALGTIGVTKKQKTDDDALIEMVDGLAQFDNTLASVMTAAQLEQTRTALDGWKSSRTEDIGGLVDERLSAVLNATNSVFKDALSQFEGEALVQGLVGGLRVENIGAQMASAVAADMNAEFRSALASGSDIQAATQSILSSAQAVQILGGAVDRLNLQFDSSATGALGDAGAIENYVGGLENLTSLQSSYFNKYFSELERTETAISDLTAGFAALGTRLPKDEENLRALIEAQELNTAAGQYNYAQLLQLSGAYKQLNDSMESQISAVYQSSLGREAEAEGIDYWMDLVTAGAMTLEQALDGIRNSAEAAALAANGGATAVQDMSDAIRTREQLERQWLTLQGDTEALRERELQQLREVAGAEEYGLEALQNRIWALEDSTARLADYERITGSIENAIDSMLVQYPGMADTRRTDALALLNNMADSGEIQQGPALDRALNAATQIDTRNYQSFEDYSRDFFRTNATLGRVRDVATAQEDRERELIEQIKNQSAEIKALRADMQASQTAIASQAQKTAKFLERFDIDGIKVRT